MRAGSWRRAIAFCADCFLVLLLLQVLAITLYPITGGRVQSEGVIRITQCQWPPPAPLSLPYGDPVVPQGIKLSERKVCRVSVLSLPHAHYLQVASDGNDHGPATVLLDDGGRATWVLWLDVLLLPVLLLYRVLMESRLGFTLGKRLTGVRIVGEEGLPSVGQSIKRSLLFLVPAFSAQLFTAGEYLASSSLLSLSSAATIVFLITAAISILWFAVAAIQITLGLDTTYDRFAGTSVVLA